MIKTEKKGHLMLKKMVKLIKAFNTLRLIGIVKILIGSNRK